MSEVSIATCRGLWRRTLLVGADGTRDTGTDVVWLQGPTGYVDSRGFAGTLTQIDDIFSWSRDVDVAPGELPDEGQMRWEADTLVEAGVHEAYEEHWVREYGGTEPAGALLLSSGSGAPAVLVRVGGLIGWATAAGARIEHVQHDDWQFHEDHVIADGQRWTVVTREGDVTL